MSSHPKIPPSTPQRSALMRRVRRQDTAPELRVRRALHAAGLRYRVHVRDLPGRPDLVLSRRRTVVFVHGCFWHGHDCRLGSVRPKANAELWAAKILGNRARDLRKQAQLEQLGWIVETVWECESKNAEFLQALARRLLSK